MREKANVVLERTAGKAFDYDSSLYDRHGIVEAVVPEDNNAWMIDSF